MTDPKKLIYPEQMQTSSLEQVIREYVQLPGATHSNGWYAVVCKVCNDHGKKGPRAGFRFDEGGVVGYHCFNCGHKAKYDPSANKRLPKNMVQVLEAFGVPDGAANSILFNALKLQENGILNDVNPQQRESDLEPKEIPLPKHFYPLANAAPNDKWALIAHDYLEQRCVDPKSHNFLLSMPEKTGVKDIDKWRGRLIIPIYKNGKLIFYTGRALYNTNKRYESVKTARDRVVYGFDRLFVNVELPLFVTEGFFDAHVIDGVALLGNEITEAQAKWLNRSKRKKIYIPDRFGDGQLGANYAIEQGWAVSTPDIGDCKDINEAVVRYGKIYVLKTISDNVAEGFAAKIKVGVYCEQNSSTKKVKGTSDKARRSM